MEVLFLPTPSARRATVVVVDEVGLFGISTHALREEGDLTTSCRLVAVPRFLPTPSARRATRSNRYKGAQLKFLPTPSARRATQAEGGEAGREQISTHALREEGDAARCPGGPQGSHFYPRPPRGGRRKDSPTSKVVGDFYPRPPRGGRHRLWRGHRQLPQFLPTPSARRATVAVAVSTLLCVISTHALREEGDGWFGQIGVDGKISTHALREEGDPVRLAQRRPVGISTHALREEGDMRESGEIWARDCISTHALREEGDCRTTPSGTGTWISTHALREEGDGVKRP